MPDRNRGLEGESARNNRMAELSARWCSYPLHEPKNVEQGMSKEEGRELSK